MGVGAVFNSGIAENRLQIAHSAVRQMGYDLHFEEATITPGPDNNFSITTKLVNYGIAPFYQTWPITVGLLDSNGTIIQEWSAPNWDIKGLVAGDERVFSGNFTASAPLPAGSQVALRVPNPMAGGKPLRFSNFNQQPDNPAWMILGGTDGSPPPSPTSKALFIRGG